MRCSLLIFAVLVAPVFADAPGDLARADQAFAAADYKTAFGLYRKVEPTLTDAAKRSAIQERMRFAAKQLDAAAGATTGPAVQTAAAARKPHARPADGKPLALSLHELGNFDYNEEDDKSIPADVRQLDGAKVKVDGVMLPLDQAGRVTRFMLVNDMMSCCYGQAPKLQNVALVEMPKDKWMAATTDRISIEGTLKVSVKRDDGFVMSIFEIQPTSIKFAAQ